MTKNYKELTDDDVLREDDERAHYQDAGLMGGYLAWEQIPRWMIGKPATGGHGFRRADPWISVADRLPDITESYPDRSVPVLARDEDGDCRVVYYEKDYDYDRHSWRIVGRDGYSFDAVDWMPIP